MPPLPSALATSKQLIVVTTTDWNTVDAQLQHYQRANSQTNWQPYGDPIHVVVGKNGLACIAPTNL